MSSTNHATGTGRVKRGLAEMLKGGGLTLDPDATERILKATAEDTPCPTPPLQTYTSEGRDPSFNALCEGTLERNGFYGFGVVDALAAVL